jgi:hypothetical protein
VFVRVVLKEAAIATDVSEELAAPFSEINLKILLPIDMALYPEDFNLHIEVPRGFTQSLQVNAEILTRLGYHHLLCFSTYVACSVQKRQQ